MFLCFSGGMDIPGQSGGRDTDKAGRCTELAFPWDEPSCKVLGTPQNVAIIPDCGSYITLHMASKQVGNSSLRAMAFITWRIENEKAVVPVCLEE